MEAPNISHQKMKMKNTAHIFVGDVCLDQRSVQAGLHVVQFLVVLEEHKSMALFTTDGCVLIMRYSSSDIQKSIQTLDWFGWTAGGKTAGQPLPVALHVIKLTNPPPFLYSTHRMILTMT